MRKYRVVAETNGNGLTRYYPERKYFLFWWRYGETIFPFVIVDKYFYCEADAIKFINEKKTDELSSKIKKREIINC